MDAYELARSVEGMVGEEWLSAPQAARLMPRARGRPVRAATVAGWIERGKRGVRLHGVRGPGKTWWTTRSAIARWLAELTALELSQTPDPTPGLLELAKAAADADASRRSRRKRA